MKEVGDGSGGSVEEGAGDGVIDSSGRVLGVDVDEGELEVTGGQVVG